MLPVVIMELAHLKFPQFPHYFARYAFDFSGNQTNVGTASTNISQHYDMLECWIDPLRTSITHYGM